MRAPTLDRFLHVFLVSVILPSFGVSAALTIENPSLALTWQGEARGWKLTSVAVGTPAGPVSIEAPSGEYTLLYASTKPSTASQPIVSAAFPGGFPEAGQKVILPRWRDATTPVALNLAGEAERFFPNDAVRDKEGITFTHHTTVAEITAYWHMDRNQPGDLQVEISMTALKDGWFSLSTPTLATLAPDKLGWAMVPGYFQGDALGEDFVLSLAYGHGLPDRPVVVRERAASSLAPLMSDRNGITFAVVPEPGTGADPWERDHDTRRNSWRLGLSHMNRAGQLSPTLYHPVLGEAGSQMVAGESRVFRFRYIVRKDDWFGVLKYTAESIYHLGDFLAMKAPKRALSDRLVALKDYLTDDETSLWRKENYDGLEIGAQSYLGGVVGSERDAMKNSDYGAMWMLGALTDDPKVTQDRLPFARNFKLKQQQTTPGFFSGAAMGQYYLWKSKRFTEEWGEYVEPVALTFYTLLDQGNMLLFNPDDAELRGRLRLGADRLLAWQQPAGNWVVAYDRHTEQPIYRELSDFRPTFYGLLVAYRVLGDEKYLDGARRGADWLLENAVARFRFLGVCGDTRFAPDFATAQIAQGLLDLYDLTGDVRYREGGIATTRFYTTSIFTHPLATSEKKQVGAISRLDWEINQIGLGFEHGGAIGSANTNGPILLASHAGLFVRVAGLTKENYYLDLARAAAWARGAFVDPATSVASYYWEAMNRGPGRYPHHAWWQIGWITDYLLAEAEFRSAGAVKFPRGFFTPKVGPHGSYGFASGRIYGESAKLRWGSVPTDHPEVDSIVALSDSGEKLFLILLNNSTRAVRSTVQVQTAAQAHSGKTSWQTLRRIDGADNVSVQPIPAALVAEIPATGLAVYVLQ